MKKIIRNITFVFLFLCSCSLNSFQSDDRIYLDYSEMDLSEDRFHIHLGGNIWIESSSIHRDETGLFALESNIIKCPKAGTEKFWKCPYCHKYWPIGKPCDNAACPSKYK